MDTHLARITQVYTYQPDNVQLGAVFVNHKSGAHRIKILTSQKKLNIRPRIGQQWSIKKEENVAVRQQKIEINGYSDSYIDVYTFMNPNLECVMPDNGRGFVTFLSKEKAFVGIGDVKAQLLWDAFRSDIFNMLESGKYAPSKHDKTITNFDVIKSVLVNNVSVHAVFEGYRSYANLKHASQFVIWEVEEPIQRQLFRIENNDAVQFLKDNPYRLFSLGMNFDKVDAIAQKHFNVASDSDIRLKAVIEHALRKWSDRGHTVAIWQDIQPTVKRLLDDDVLLLSRAKCLDSNVIGFVKENNKYYVSGNYVFEKTIAKRFAKLRQKTFNWSEKLESAFIGSRPTNWTLTKAQAKSVKIALTSPLFVLSGGAGTGKTATLKVIVDMYLKMGFDVHAVALSGKAAKRLKQSIGIDTKTIAKLLRDNDIDNQKSLLLIDEASMIDAYSMWRLVTMLPPESRILLAGDENQLPPINAGFVLSDVIKSGVVEHVELDVVKRTGATSSIPAYANAIRCGKIPTSMSTHDIEFIESQSIDIVNDAVDAYKGFQGAMIVAPTNNTVRKVNIAVQNHANPNGKLLDLIGMPVEQGSYAFREGDPVVITRTSYQNDVQNGTLGHIKSVDACEEYALVLELEDEDEHGKKRELKVDWDLFEYIDLAYCLTLHKLQGSQAENVIVLLERGSLLDRSWLYTSITRTENRLRIIGKHSDFIYAVNKKGAIDVRKTALCEMLKNV